MSNFPERSLIYPDALCKLCIFCCSELSAYADSSEQRRTKLLLIVIRTLLEETEPVGQGSVSHKKDESPLKSEVKNKYEKKSTFICLVERCHDTGFCVSCVCSRTDAYK